MSPPPAPSAGPDEPGATGPAGAPRLVARTRALVGDDPRSRQWLHAASHVRFEHRGAVLAGGMGTTPVALRIALPRTDPAAASLAVHAALDAIVVDDEVGHPGCGPVAFGALPFDGDAPAELVVPNVIVGRTAGGEHWITTIGPETDGTTGHPANAGAPPPAGGDGSSEVGATSTGGDPTGGGSADDGSAITVASVRSPEDWCAAVAAARDALRAGRARKVVLARELTATTREPIDVAEVLHRLRHAYDGCFLYSMPLAGGARLVGASPELLVARSGEVVRSHPMAGTAPRSGDPEIDLALAAELLASLKDQVEHRITIDMVHDTLLPWCSYLDEEAEPSIVAVANVQHLATMVEGRLSAPPASVIELVTALHPTPAVCGDPRAEALALIARYEGFDRGSYAGPVGWVDHRGNGEWAVGIRCAEIGPTGRTARLFAGVGVVADSDPGAELAETEAKLRAMRSALG